jgi:hypothetical protein
MFLVVLCCSRSVLGEHSQDYVLIGLATTILVIQFLANKLAESDAQSQFGYVLFAQSLTSFSFSPSVPLESSQRD